MSTTPISMGVGEAPMQAAVREVELRILTWVMAWESNVPKI